MYRTTVMLPANLKARAMRRAKQKGISLGDLIREALAAALRQNRKTEESDPFFSDHEVYDGPVPADGAKNHDRYLYGDSSDIH